MNLSDLLATCHATVITPIRRFQALRSLVHVVDISRHDLGWQQGDVDSFRMQIQWSHTHTHFTPFRVYIRQLSDVGWHITQHNNHNKAKGHLEGMLIHGPNQIYVSDITV